MSEKAILYSAPSCAKMKILLVNDFGRQLYGAEIQMLILRDGLRRRGYDVRYFASYAGCGRGRSAADYECFGTISRFQTLLQTANPWAFWTLRRVLADFQPDLVHVRMFLGQLSPLILLLLRNRPSLYHIALYEAICPLGTKMLPDGNPCRVPAGMACYDNRCLPLRAVLPQMLRMILWRRWRHAFNLIVANSEAVRRRFLAEFDQPVEVVLNGIPARSPRLPLSFPPTVAFAGRLIPEKGVTVLVRAFARVVKELPDAHLLLAGEGPERNRLEKLIATLKLSQSISLLGHLPHPELDHRFSTAWVQAVPSLWEEPFGIVAAESMMRGTAVVASNSGGLAEIVQDGRSGILVPPGDEAVLAEALLLLLRNRDLAEQMGRAGRETALTQFNETTFVDKFIRLYEKL
jgi:glycosyltransferase involved in cell wall biosynthesis